MLNYILLLFLINIYSQLNPPYITGLSVYDSEGIGFSEGVLKILELPKTVVIFGVDLHRVKNIYLTHAQKNKGADCMDTRFPLILDSTIKFNELGTVHFETNDLLPWDKNLYFCISFLNPQNQTVFVNQGPLVVLMFVKPHFILPFWAVIMISGFLIILSGLFSGLNLGLMSLNIRELNLIITTGTPSERKNARGVLPIRRQGNVLLCSILIGNTIVNSTTAILLESVTSGLISIVLSTIVIVIFGEVIPQSICAKYGLFIGAKTRYFTWFVIIITFPICYPLGKMLDCFVGYDTPIMYKRHQLLEVVKQNAAGNLEDDEAGIIYGALKFKSKTVSEIMTPIDQCYLVNENSVLDFKMISEIMKSGYSRIPVYSNERFNVTSLLHIKDLAFIDPDDMIPLSSVVNFYNHPLIKVVHDTKLDVVFKQFKEGLAHLGIVVKLKFEENTEPISEAIGIVTLEDIIEEIIQAEICDETDINQTPHDFSNIEFSKSVNKHHIRQFFEKSQSSIPEITPNVLLSLCQFMSTAIPCFRNECITTNILSRLIAHPGVAMKRNFSENYYLYHKDVSADYFILIVEGRVEILIGSENLVFTQGPFSFYGHTFLEQFSKNLTRTTFIDKPKPTFTPDFSLRIVTDVVYLKINFSMYQIAVEATKLEQTRKQDGDKVDDIWKTVMEKSPPQRIQSQTEVTPFKPEIIVIDNNNPKVNSTKRE